MKVALVYDRVNKWGGAERVLMALHEIFPDAPLYTSVYAKETAKWSRVFSKIIPSFLQKIPLAKNNHEKLALFMPMVFESFDFREYDLVISLTSESAKGLIAPPDTKHVCICLTPTRYLWSGHDLYFKGLAKAFLYPFIGYLRKWDKIAAHRPDAFIAISTEVQQRISKYYNRKSTLIYPPVDFNIKTTREVSTRKGYLIVSRLVNYKMIDLAVKAFNDLNEPLTIVGIGKEEDSLKDIANSNITFLGSVDDEELSHLYSSHKGLIMPQLEDFGLVSVESQLHGTPVIAYGKGGSLDTIINGKTGILFEHQTKDDIVKAVKEFEMLSFNQQEIVNNASKFNKETFKLNLMKFIHNL